MDWAGGPVAEGDPKMPRRGFVFWVALRYRYKRDLRKEPRVTASFGLLTGVGLLSGDVLY